MNNVVSDNKKQKTSVSFFRVNSVVLLVLMFFLMLCFLAMLIYVSFNNYAMQERSIIVGIASLLLVLCIGIIVVYISTIYIPICRLRRSIQLILDGKYEQLFPENKINDSSEMLQEFNSILLKIHEIVSSEYSSKLSKKHAELNALQSQINPHFLYNTIDSIRGQAINDGVESIANTAKSLAAVFRYCIDNPTMMVSLKDELEHISNYFAIQQYRFNDRFELNVKYEQGRDDLSSCMLPRLTIQPIVENAIVHGLETKVGKGVVNINIVSTQSRLIISVEDDGLGINPSDLSAINHALLTSDKTELNKLSKNGHGNKMALFNVNSRIKMTFGCDYGIHLYSTYGIGTKSEISLPIVKDVF